MDGEVGSEPCPGSKAGQWLQAWHDLAHYGAHRSAADNPLGAEKIMQPARATTEQDLQLKLGMWLQQVAEHEARFMSLYEDVKTIGL